MSDDKIPGLGDLYLLIPQEEKLIRILNQLPVCFLTDDDLVDMFKKHGLELAVTDKIPM